MWTSLGNKCKHCGITDRRVLELHHINGRKENKDYRKQTYSKRFWKELEILCANCHKIKHYDLKRNSTIRLK